MRNKKAFLIIDKKKSYKHIEWLLSISLLVYWYIFSLWIKLFERNPFFIMAWTQNINVPYWPLECQHLPLLPQGFFSTITPLFGRLNSIGRILRLVFIDLGLLHFLYFFILNIWVRPSCVCLPSDLLCLIWYPSFILKEILDLRFLNHKKNLSIHNNLMSLLNGPM